MLRSVQKPQENRRTKKHVRIKLNPVMKYNLKQFAFFFILAAGIAYIFVLQYKNRKLGQAWHELAQQQVNMGVFTQGEACVLQVGTYSKNVQPNQVCFIVRRNLEKSQVWVMTHYQSGKKLKTRRIVPNSDPVIAISCLSSDNQLIFNTQSLELSKYQGPRFSPPFYTADTTGKLLAIRSSRSTEIDTVAIRFFLYPESLKEPPGPVEWHTKPDTMINACDENQMDVIYFELQEKEHVQIE